MEPERDIFQVVENMTKEIAEHERKHKNVNKGDLPASDENNDYIRRNLDAKDVVHEVVNASNDV